MSMKLFSLKHASLVLLSLACLSLGGASLANQNVHASTTSVTSSVRVKLSHSSAKSDLSNDLPHFLRHNAKKINIGKLYLPSVEVGDSDLSDLLSGYGMDTDYYPHAQEFYMHNSEFGYVKYMLRGNNVYIHNNGKSFLPKSITYSKCHVNDIEFHPSDHHTLSATLYIKDYKTSDGELHHVSKTNQKRHAIHLHVHVDYIPKKSLMDSATKTIGLL